MMGRKPDTPEEQAQKGYPGKRRSRVEKQHAEALRLAEMMASAPAVSSDPLAPPAYLDGRLAPALAVWNEYVPQLRKLNLFDRLDRHTFSIFCVYMGEFVLANEDILTKGYSVAVKTVSGDHMLRKNPSVGRRDKAYDVVMEMAKRFGLTPIDRYALIKDQAQMPNGGLFGGQPAPKAPDDAPSPEVEGGEEQVGVNVLHKMNSLPPGLLPN